MEVQLKQNPEGQPPFVSAIEEAVLFLQDVNNVHKKWRGCLTYKQTLNLVKNFIKNARPNLNLEGLSIETLQKILNEILNEENLESRVPPNLQGLIEEAAKAEKESQLERDRVARKIEAWTETVEARYKNSQFRKRVQESASDTSSRLTQGVRPEIREIAAEEIAAAIQFPDSLLLSLKKTETLPEEQQVVERQRITEELQKSFKKAGSSVIASLKEKGAIISPEEEWVLLNIQLSPENIVFLARELERPAEERKEIQEWVAEQLSPPLEAIPEKQATEIATLVYSAMVGKLPEYDVRTFEQLSPEEFVELKTKFEETVVAALAEVAPEIVKITEIPPGKIPQLIAAFVPQSIDELKERTVLLTAPLETRNVSLSLPPLEPIEVTELTPKTPLLFATAIKRASQGDPLQITDEKGKRFVDELNELLHKQGINKVNALGFRNEVLKKWAILLTANAIIPEDIDNTIKTLIQNGEKEGSPRIRELGEIKQALSNFQEQLPKEVLQEIKKQSSQDGQKGSHLVETPSRFQTPILRQSPFNPNFNILTKLNSLTSRIFGKKILHTSSGQPVIINKLSLLKNNLLQSLKTRFFKTSFGKIIKTGLEKIGQKSLQALWSTVKAGAKQFVIKGVTSLVTKLGLHAIFQAIGSIAPGIGNLIALAGSFLIDKVIKGGFSLLKGIGSLFGISGGVFEGLTGQISSYESKENRWLAMIFIGLFIGIIAVPLLNSSFLLQSAFLGKGGVWEEELPGVPVPPEVAPNCTPSRDLSEEIICQLSQGSDPCDQNIVNSKTWENKVAKCFEIATFPNKTEVKDIFYYNLQYIKGSKTKNLQCTGFTRGVEKGRGHVLEGGRDARQYLEDPLPPGYQRIRGDDTKIKTGDIAIWKGKKYGHIAVVIQPDADTKTGVNMMYIAEGDGYTGMISIRGNVPFGRPGTGDGSPDGYLRPI